MFTLFQLLTAIVIAGAITYFVGYSNGSSKTKDILLNKIMKCVNDKEADNRPKGKTPKYPWDNPYIKPEKEDKDDE